MTDPVPIDFGSFRPRLHPEVRRARREARQKLSERLAMNEAAKQTAIIVIEREHAMRNKMAEIAYHEELNTCPICGRPPSMVGEMTGWGCTTCVEDAEFEKRGEVPHPPATHWAPDDEEHDDYYRSPPIDE